MINKKRKKKKEKIIKQFMINKKDDFKTLNPLNNPPYHIVIDRLPSTIIITPIVVIN
jgi:hypothetical protein